MNMDEQQDGGDRDEAGAEPVAQDPAELGETAGKNLGGINTGPQHTPDAQDAERE